VSTVASLVRMKTLVSSLAAVLLAAGAIIAVQATPAQAASGYEVKRGQSANNSSPEKSAIATCPEGKRVTGGGGGIVWNPSNTREVLITQMQPVHGAYRDSFQVTAHETADGEDGNWYIEAYAICMDPLDGMHIESSMSAWNSNPTKLETVECDAGEVVLGSGAYIYGSYGYVGLQVMRASLNTDFSYAQGREEEAFSGIWYVVAYAVCAPSSSVSGYEIEQWRSDEDDSESVKSAVVQCDQGKKIYGMGGATGFDASSHVSLIRIAEPYFDDRQTDVFAVENSATTADWDYIVAQAVCAY